MKRIQTSARPDWRKIVESLGMTFHTADDVKYWDESVYYEFTSKEVDVMEAATNELHAMCLEAVQNVIDNKRYAELQIPATAIPLIESSWNEETPAIYGRFDLAFNGKDPPKMLEYNADTPTSLLEAAVVQWNWLEDQHNGCDQFNSIHDRLIKKWTELKEYLKAGALYFTYMDSEEDYMNITYMRDTAHQAGIKTKEIAIEDIGYDSKDGVFVDKDYMTMHNIFKLYPWEWLLKDQFGAHLLNTLGSTYWIEPPWKMVLSNKGILPILWELNPGHPNLLPAYFEPSKLPWHVKKPFYSREGANISMVTEFDTLQETEGKYGEEGYIYQELCLLPKFDDNYPVIGSWVIDGESAGIGIRESNSLITNNLSRFIPHLMK